MSAASDCFRIAGERVRQGKTFCHPDDGNCSHEHNFQVTEPSGLFLTGIGDPIPLHTTWLLCTEHESEYTE